MNSAIVGTDVLLIQPVINPRTQRKFVTDVIRASFPFSLGHLAAYLIRERGASVRVHDDQIQYLEDESLAALLGGDAAPKIVGITALTVTCGRSYELARKIKRLAPGTLIVLGGVHAAVLPEEALGKEGVDLVVRGEGEETLAEILDAVRAGRDFSAIAGVSYRKGDAVVHNPDRPLIRDLNALPPFPYELFAENRDRYPGFFSIQTSRGCPYGCTFCSQRSVSGRGYRYVTTERAIADITTLVERYGASQIRIMDDNIGANKRRLLELLDRIVALGLHRKVSFEAPLRGDNIDEEVLEKLKAANFTLVTFGLETGSERLMKLINKGESVAEVVRAIRMTAAKGISVGTTLIFGLPTETAKERWDAIRLVSSLPIASVRFNILAPYPGTPVYEELARENKLLVKPDWENFSVQYMWEGDDLPYVPDGTDRYALMFTTMFANLWFYVRPSGIWKLLTKPAAGGNVIALRQGWYFSGFAFKLLRVGFYLTLRFAEVFFKMLWRKVTRCA